VLRDRLYQQGIVDCVVHLPQRANEHNGNKSVCRLTIPFGRRWSAAVVSRLSRTKGVRMLHCSGRGEEGRPPACLPRPAQAGACATALALRPTGARGWSANGRAALDFRYTIGEGKEGFGVAAGPGTLRSADNVYGEDSEPETF